MTKKNLAVFFGGRSCEHEISIITAQQAMAVADRDKYEVYPIYITPGGEWRYDRAFGELKTFENDAADMGAEVLFTPGGPTLYRVVRRRAFTRHCRREKQNRADPSAQIPKRVKPLARIDAALLCMHGLNGEDGTLQGLLELSGVPYTSCGVTASAAFMDKIVSKYIFRGLGLKTVDFAWFTAAEFEGAPEACLDKAEEAAGYPCIVKPANLGSSIGISVCKDRTTLKEAVEVAVQYDRRILVERALTDFYELNCSVLGSEDGIAVSECEKPAAWHEFLTFEDKYLSSGKQITNYKLQIINYEEREADGGKDADNEKNVNIGMASLKREFPAKTEPALRDNARAAAEMVFKALDCKGVVRVDFMVDKTSGIIYISEVNTIPGSLSFYLWEPEGLSFGRLIDRLVDIAIREHSLKSSLTYAYKTDVIRNAAKNMKMNK